MKSNVFTPKTLQMIQYFTNNPVQKQKTDLCIRTFFSCLSSTIFHLTTLQIYLVTTAAVLCSVHVWHVR